MIQIPFNKPPVTGHEETYVLDAMRSDKISGDGAYCRKCEAWFEAELGCSKAFLTPSCTHALEMCAILLNIQEGDEVVMPSYTFVSTANAFVLRGAKIVFVDIRPDTMNIDEALVEGAITAKTRAIVAVHYAGVACEMEVLVALAEKYQITLIEDAAQGIGASYRGRKLGSFGKMSAFSFHETKNCTSGGEGGMLILNDPALVERAEILREKGTNRMQFFRGECHKYNWVDVGSSYLASELQAAFLFAQLEHLNELNKARLEKWHFYNQSFQDLATQAKVELASIPRDCEHNAHIFYLKLQDEYQRDELIAKFADAGVLAVFHYVPLHSSPGGQRFSRFHGEDVYTTSESLRILRLPLWHGLEDLDMRLIQQVVNDFFR